MISEEWKCWQGYWIQSWKSYLAGHDVYEYTSKHVFLDKKRVCECGATTL